MSNAERQAAWRERRARELAALRNAKPGKPAPKPARAAAPAAAELEEEIDDLKNEVRKLRAENQRLQRIANWDGLLSEIEPLIKQLEEQGRRNMATMVPAAVAECAHRLRLFFDPKFRARIEKKLARARG